MAYNGTTSRVVLAVLALPALLLLACGEETPLGGLTALLPRCDIPFTDLLESTSLSTSEALPSGIVGTPEEFCRIWESISTVHPCDPGLIDFETEVVLVTSSVSLHTCGYGLRVDCVQSGHTAGSVEVRLATRRPGYGCLGLGCEWRNEIAMVKVPRPVASATFEIVRSFKVDCL